ncbi:MAG: hypothetical protein K0R55_671 [Sporomusa sp.]|jgi:hypothetical protein|nr:hypothetical protein [Sporomusa sp.]
MQSSWLKENYLQMKDLLQSPAQPVQVILRILAAVVGGYWLTYSCLTALALLLPWPRLNVVFFSALFPALFYLGTLLWAFAAPTAQRAWRDIMAGTAFFAFLSLAAVWIR